MRLSWNEIRARAARFADDWADAAYEKGETQSFYNDFFDIFGVRRRSVARYFPPPAFDSSMREALLDACRFDWTPISPAIFGALFQSVMEPAERRAKGKYNFT